MQLFTGLEYLKIDIANNTGFDKLNYQERIDKTNQLYPENTVKYATDEQLKELVLLNNPEEPELVFAGLMAYRDTLNNIPTGYRVAFDSCCSGSQLMSALTRDKSGLNLTGMIENQRMDLYTEVFKRFKQISGVNTEVERKHIKKGVMTANYGSTRKPEQVLGKHNIPYFQQVMDEMCNGAWTLRQLLIDHWDSNESIHKWILPDGYTAYCPVEVKNTYSFKYEGEEYFFELKEIEATPSGLSNVANVVHSVDSYIVREMIRRTKFDKSKVMYVYHLLNQYKEDNGADLQEGSLDTLNKFDVLLHMYESSNMLSVAIIDEIQSILEVARMSSKHRQHLLEVIDKMLSQGTFDMVVIHDSFTCHPNKMNYVRYWYNHIVANIVDSDLLQVILDQISPYEIKLDRQLNTRKTLANLVLKSNYGIC